MIRRWPALAVCLIGGVLASLWFGQDANYDLANYHLYNGWALLHGRFDRDLLAAGMQTYLNPLLDAPYAAMALGPLRRHPVAVAAAMGLPAGIATYLAWRVALLLYSGRMLLALAATAIGVTGVMFVGEIGTTLNDLPVAAVLFGGMLALLGGPSAARRFLAGTLFGASAGLKLTALVFAPAAAAASVSRHGWRGLPALAAGWVAGFALTDGWWAVMLWRRFASPVFPLMNGLFRSPWYPPVNFVDDRFLPGSVWQAALYPFVWFFAETNPVNELPLRDGRGALVMALGVAVVLAGLCRRSPAMPPAARAALAFLLTGYVAWLAGFGIARYAIVLEVLAGLCIPLLLGRLLPSRAILGATAAAAVLLLTTARYGSFGRIPAIELAADMRWVQPGDLLVLTLRVPSAHVLPFMPWAKQVAALNLDFATLDARGWRLHDETLRRVRAHEGRIMVITPVDPTGLYAELGEIGLELAPGPCTPITSTYTAPGPLALQACEARRAAPATMPSAFWAQAAARYRTVVQPQRDAGPLIGQAYLTAAGPAARGTRFLDWTDLLWNGVGRPHDTLPERPDPGTLYVLAPPFVSAMAARMDPARDTLGMVDGWTVLAPGWRTCSECTAAPQPPLP